MKKFLVLSLILFSVICVKNTFASESDGKWYSPYGGLYDKNGYDENGYDREGYKKDGFNSEGYNRENYDRYGRYRFDD